MNYIEVEFICTPNNEIVNSLLPTHISDLGFDSFEESETGVKAYILENIFDTSKLDEILIEFPIEAVINYTYKNIESKNWNEEWEKNYFQPLIIDDKCIVQSTFHNIPPTYEYNIFIDPKMAFGTGHHQTTELMIREILAYDFVGKSVLDMGCGTAILAILAQMRGAKPITAIDIDEWAYENAVQNIELNNTQDINVLLGDADILGKEKYDIILANINRNILLNDIHTYCSVLGEGGVLFMSGFYTEDIPVIQEECERYGLGLCKSSSKDNWAMVVFSAK